MPFPAIRAERRKPSGTDPESGGSSSTTTAAGNRSAEEAARLAAEKIEAKLTLGESPALGKLPIDEVPRERVKRFVAHLRAKKAVIADRQNVKNRAFHPCLVKAKLRRIKFHDLRPTFTSLLVQNGESLAYVKGQLGPASK